ncbi:hypothetical protein GCM10022205_45180 [Spinactinospora alkalitolerans]
MPQQRTRTGPVEERGRTVIPDAVIAKIAVRAAAEVGGTRDVHRRLGALLGSGTRPARAQARSDGNVVTLRLGIAVHYPEPLRGATREVREHVREKVEVLTGLAVRHIDIEVTELVRDGRIS